MRISNITFQYNDATNEIIGYTVYVDGRGGSLGAFSGQVNLSSEDLDFNTLKEQVRARIEQAFAEDKE